MGKPFQRGKIDEREMWRLYSLGKTDEQIAEALDIHKNTVQGWRKRNCLSVNKKINRKLTQLEQDAIAARMAGMTYGQYKAQQSLGLIGGKKK